MLLPSRVWSTAQMLTWNQQKYLWIGAWKILVIKLKLRWTWARIRQLSKWTNLRLGILMRRRTTSKRLRNCWEMRSTTSPWELPRQEKPRVILLDLHKQLIIAWKKPLTFKTTQGVTGECQRLSISEGATMKLWDSTTASLTSASMDSRECSLLRLSTLASSRKRWGCMTCRTPITSTMRSTRKGAQRDRIKGRARRQGPNPRERRTKRGSQRPRTLTCWVSRNSRRM